VTIAWKVLGRAQAQIVIPCPGNYSAAKDLDSCQSTLKTEFFNSKGRELPVQRLRNFRVWRTTSEFLQMTMKTYRLMRGQVSQALERVTTHKQGQLWGQHTLSPFLKRLRINILRS
jgi:hypothetical protein